MITTFFFDIGNVLLAFDHQLIWQRLLPFSALSSEALQKRIQLSGLMNQHETGALPPLDFFHEIQREGKLLPSLGYERFARFWADIFREQTPIVQLASSLQRNYRIGLLSNIGEIHWNWILMRYPFFRQVETGMRVLSFECGCMKPAKAIYQKALERAQEKPEHCVYIDDIRTYTESSRELGIQGIQYQSPEQLARELDALGVNAKS
ncbi:MAG: HAD family phosphatase [bacterium]|nr:HAD family phosphatase [bacterium]